MNKTTNAEFSFIVVLISILIASGLAFSLIRLLLFKQRKRADMYSRDE